MPKENFLSISEEKIKEKRHGSCLRINNFYRNHTFIYSREICDFAFAA
jgi:hypothetical protein